jgi:hypothetical protein
MDPGGQGLGGERAVAALNPYAAGDQSPDAAGWSTSSVMQPPRPKRTTSGDSSCSPGVIVRMVSAPPASLPRTTRTPAPSRRGHDRVHHGAEHRAGGAALNPSASVSSEPGVLHW